MSTVAWKEKNQDRLREYRRTWYQRNQQKAIANAQVNRERCIEEFRRWKATLKCNQCDENHPACLEFHHPDASQKEAHVSRLAHSGQLKKAMKEAAKCEVVCANCHRKIHHASVA